MKPKYNFQPLYTATSLSRKDWIHGPEVLGESRGLSDLQASPGETGICKLDTRFFFSLANEMGKIRPWKWACLSIGGSAGVPGGGGGLIYQGLVRNR
jgi:hypothetical protein